MPAPQSGSPMTYTYDGKEYVMVAVSGGNYSGDYLAYALPNGNFVRHVKITGGPRKRARRFLLSAPCIAHPARS